jgi:CubicO group peptidase (beta-lactamase class C family)
VSTVLSDLQSRLDEAAVRRGVPGAAVAVGLGDELAEAATGVLNRNTGVTATPDSLFQVGSIGKVWTAALVLELVDEGLVDLDRPVRTYLPDFAVADPEVSATVTVRQLLVHTGGFEGDVFTDTGRGDDALDRYLARLRDDATQVSPPGAMFSYCNAGYIVLGVLAARLRGGGTYESVVRDRIIGPLGLRHAALSAEEAVLFRVAAGHAGGAVATSWQFPRSFGPAGGVPFLAPRELVRFGRLFRPGATGPLSRMTVPQVREPGVPHRGAGGRGLGPVLFDWDGITGLGHDGSVTGQSAQWRVVPELGLVVAMCANTADATGFFDDMLDWIVRELTGHTVPARPVPPDGPHQPGPAHLAGRYHRALCTYEVVAAGEGLDVTAVPHGVAAADGSGAATERYVALTGSTFITARAGDDGTHPTLTFLDEGRYLYAARVAKRVP